MIDWSVVAAVLGSLATIFGGIRWLLKVYFSQQSKIEKLKDSLLGDRIKELNETVEKLVQAMDTMEHRMESVEASFERASSELEENKDGIGNLTSSMRAFVDDATKRIVSLEQQIAGSKVVRAGKDTYIFKGEKKKP